MSGILYMAHGYYRVLKKPMVTIFGGTYAIHERHQYAHQAEQFGASCVRSTIL